MAYTVEQIGKPELGNCLVRIGSVRFTVHGGLTDNGFCVTCGEEVLEVPEAQELVEWRREFQGEPAWN